MSKHFALPCIVCGKQLEHVFGPLDGPDGFNNQPNNGLAFYTFGHYGSTVFDPGGSYVRMEISICDACIQNSLAFLAFSTEPPKQGRRQVEYLNGLPVNQFRRPKAPEMDRVASYFATPYPEGAPEVIGQRTPPYVAGEAPGEEGQKKCKACGHRRGDHAVACYGAVSLLGEPPCPCPIFVPIIPNADY